MHGLAVILPPNRAAPAIEPMRAIIGKIPTPRIPSSKRLCLKVRTPLNENLDRNREIVFRPEMLGDSILNQQLNANRIIFIKINRFSFKSRIDQKSAIQALFLTEGISITAFCRSFLRV
jgi:hypothetical protein